MQQKLKPFEAIKHLYIFFGCITYLPLALWSGKADTAQEAAITSLSLIPVRLKTILLTAAMKI